jgi:2-polyprenyl-6-hydroxyphenyl methylase/3-demethylubiquinone-9 3-methyltransferase
MARAASRSRSTADSDDVARFSRIAATWWDPNGPFRPLHRINPVRIGYIRDRLAGHFGREALANRPLRDLTVLDIGCGGGLLAEPLCRLGATVTGIDASAETIGVAATHAKAMRLAVTYRRAEPETLAAEGKRFDAVLALEVVEHAADMDAFLGACAQLLAPGGCLVLSTLNRTLKSLALGKIGAEYILRWVPPGTHDWRKFVKPSELVGGLRHVGVDVTDLTGMSFDPAKGDWALGSDLDVNYLVFGVTP